VTSALGDKKLGFIAIAGYNGWNEASVVIKPLVFISLQEKCKPSREVMQ